MLTVERAARDIESMRVRGAGLLARHAVRSLRDLAQAHKGTDAALAAELRAAGERLLATRPSAVSLRNAVEEALRPLDGKAADLRGEVAAAAQAFLERSEAAVEAISARGAALLDGDGIVLTHCNSACSVGVIVEAAKARSIEAYATETRPRRQGHLTSAQLRAAGVPVTLLVDSAANSIMPRVDWVVVGADSIARNGDVINKVGTSQVALSAREHGVPVYVAAETYKIDRRAARGRDVRIEERAVSEVLEGAALRGVRVWNPVFDVTPARHVRRIVTELGVTTPQGVRAMAQRLDRAPPSRPAARRKDRSRARKGRRR